MASDKFHILDDIRKEEYNKGRADALDELVAEVECTVLANWHKTLIKTIAGKLKEGKKHEQNDIT